MESQDPVPTQEEELPEHPSGFLGVVRKLGFVFVAVLPIFLMGIAVMLYLNGDGVRAVALVLVAALLSLTWRQSGTKRSNRTGG